MTGEGTGDGVEATAPPVMLTLIVRNSERGRAQRSGEMVIIGRDGGGIPSVGREGDSSPQKRRKKTPHYGRAYPRRGLENRTPPPHMPLPLGGDP